MFAKSWTDDIREITPSYSRVWWREGEYRFPFSYRLYDFNNNGVPDVLIWYDFDEEGMWGIHILYVYENGYFVRVGGFSYWGELFTDGQGNFYSLEGSHQEGFVRIIHFAFTHDGAIWEILANIGCRTIELSEDEHAALVELGEPIWYEVSFSPPSFKGVPLTVVKPFELPGLFEAAAQNSIVHQEVPVVYTEVIESPNQYPVSKEELLKEVIPEVTMAEDVTLPNRNFFIIWLVIPLAVIVFTVICFIRKRFIGGHHGK